MLSKCYSLASSLVAFGLPLPFGNFPFLSEISMYYKPFTTSFCCTCACIAGDLWSVSLCLTRARAGPKLALWVSRRGVSADALLKKTSDGKIAWLLNTTLHIFIIENLPGYKLSIFLLKHFP